MRRGIEEHLADAGFRYFFVDAHLASAGRPLGLSGDPAALDPEVHHPAARATAEAAQRSPYQAYRVAQYRGAGDVSAYVRDPRASMQVWSRFEGYPGDGVYLEFHKMRWPGGLKLWRVSGPGVDLGAKQPYDPGQALDRARGHADHFAGLLGGIAAAEAGNRDGVIVAPFDTELFGHWWFEGPDFLGDVYRALRGRPDVHPATGSGHLLRHPPRAAIRMPSGSWGANGDFTHVAQRADRVDLGAALAAGAALLGRGAGRAGVARQPAPSWPRPRASCCWPSPPTGSSSSRPARRRTTPSGGSASTASETEELVAALVDGSRRGARARRSGGRRAGRARRALPRRAARGGRGARRLALARRSAEPMAPIRFAFGLHLHQPVGNFDHVFAQHVEDVYRPLLEPSPTREFLPVVLHLSGPLLEWLEAHEPAYLDQLGRLAADGRIELLLAGFYEPVLASLPRADRVEQIQWMHEAVRRRFGVDAAGLWLTERVWEPELAADLADAGVRYALVDDRHFLVSGFAAEQLHAPFWTESDGKRVALFPDRRAAPLPDPVPSAGGDRRVPARAPGRRPPAGGPGRRRREVRRLAGHQGVGVRAAAGWSASWRPSAAWSRAARCSSARSTTRWTPCRAAASPICRPASYREMESWSLPPDAALRLIRLERDLGEARVAGPDGALIRGAHWRNFLVKYSGIEPDAQEDAWRSRCSAAGGAIRPRLDGPSAGPSATTRTGTASSVASTCRICGKRSGAIWRRRRRSSGRDRDSRRGARSRW